MLWLYNIKYLLGLKLEVFFLLLVFVVLESFMEDVEGKKFLIVYCRFCIVMIELICKMCIDV